jgi:hypothetical protein
MNNSNAAARKRRAPPLTESINKQPSQNINVSQQQQQQSTGHTLPQIIAIIDNRLLLLEKHIKEDSGNSGERGSLAINELQSEYDNRFEMLVREIDSIKEIIIKLQSYTMDVNKILVEEHTTNKIILEKEKEFHNKVLDQVDKTHKSLMDVIVANNNERLNEYKETNKNLLDELKRITELNVRLSSVGTFTNKINDFNKQPSSTVEAPIEIKNVNTNTAIDTANSIDEFYTNNNFNQTEAPETYTQILFNKQNNTSNESSHILELLKEPDDNIEESIENLSVSSDTNDIADNSIKPKNRRYKLK